jgi:hypothetical protein
LTGISLCFTGKGYDVVIGISKTIALNKRIKMKIRFILFSIILLCVFVLSILLNLSCKKSPMEPPYNLQQGRRDYSWAIDTLFVPEGKSYPVDIWGTGSNNVWACGPAYLNSYCIWHYDGVRWSNYHAQKFIDPRGIFGFSKKDIWIGSLDGSFWHYDGVDWNKSFQTNINNYNPFIVQSICGISTNDIYATGFADSIDGNSYKGIIMHYDGSKWELVNIPVIHESFVQLHNIKGTNEYLFRSWIFNSPENHIYHLKNNQLKKIYTTTDSDMWMTSIGNQIYFTAESKIYKYENEQIIFYKEFPSSQYLGRMWGRSENDFFTENWDGIGHYDGKDLITIYKKANVDWGLNEAIVFDTEVFFIWMDTRTGITFVIHGKLKY